MSFNPLAWTRDRIVYSVFKSVGCRRLQIVVVCAIFLTNSVVPAFSTDVSVWEHRRQRLSVPKNPPPVDFSHKALPPFSPSGKISPAYGTVRHIYPSVSSSSSNHTVYFIQDVHRNFEAQKNISALIQELARKEKVRLVALEGAFGALDFNAFQTFGDADSVKKSADLLLQQGVISGPVHAALNLRNGSPRFHGVDHPDAYEANVGAFLASLADAGKVGRRHADLKEKLSARKERVFSKALKAFDEKVESFHEEKISFPDYVSFLTGFANALPKNIALFKDAAALEKEIDFDQASEQQKRVASVLVRKLDKKNLNLFMRRSLAFQSGAISPVAYYDELQKTAFRLGVVLSDYPDFEAYARYAGLADRIDARKLFDEQRDLENGVYASLARSQEEAKLVLQSRRTILTGKLIGFSLTSQEWEEYRRLNKLMESPLRAQLRPYEQFYERANSRDAKMGNELVRKMKAGNSASIILVAGGFHSDAIREKLTREGASVVMITPKITRVESAGGSSYLSVFAQEKTPLEELFKGERLFLAPRVWTRPQRFLQRILIGLRHAWLAAGSMRKTEFDAVINDLGEDYFKKVEPYFGDDGSCGVTVENEALVRTGINHDGNFQPVLELAATKTKSVKSLPWKVWAYVTDLELHLTLPLIFGRHPFVRFIREHSFKKRLITIRQIKSAKVIQRASWVALALIGVAFASSDFSWKVVFAGVIGLVLMQALLHKIQRRLFPNAKLMVTDGEDTEETREKKRIMQDLVRRIKEFPEDVGLAFFETLQSEGMLPRILELVEAVEAGSKNVSKMTISRDLNEIVMALIAAQEYNNLPAVGRSTSLAASKSSNRWLYMVYKSLEKNASMQMVIRQIIDYYTDPAKVGEEQAAMHKGVLMTVNLDEIGVHISRMNLDIETENIAAILKYEILRWRQNREPDSTILVDRFRDGFVHTDHGNIPILVDFQSKKLQLDEKKQVPVHSCPNCGVQNSNQVPQEVAFVKVNGEPLSIAECPICKLRWISPQPDDVFLTNMYDSDYFNPKGDTHQLGIDAFSPAAEERRKTVAQRQIKEWVESAAIGRVFEFIEVGPGGGYLMQAVKDRWPGARVQGIDISRYIVEELSKKDLPVFHGTIEQYAATLPPGRGTADVIALYDLIEHVRDLNSLMEAAKRMLRVGGKLLIRTPNNVARLPELHLIDHLWHLTPDSLELLAKAHGFKVIYRKASGIFVGTDERTLENMTVFLELIDPKPAPVRKIVNSEILPLTQKKSPEESDPALQTVPETPAAMKEIEPSLAYAQGVDGLAPERHGVKKVASFSLYRFVLSGLASLCRFDLADFYAQVLSPFREIFGTAFSRQSVKNDLKSEDVSLVDGNPAPQAQPLDVPMSSIRKAREAA